jgi:hypothetical protein
VALIAAATRRLFSLTHWLDQQIAHLSNQPLRPQYSTILTLTSFFR